MACKAHPNFGWQQIAQGIQGWRHLVTETGFKPVLYKTLPETNSWHLHNGWKTIFFLLGARPIFLCKVLVFMEGIFHSWFESQNR